jgi:signal peptidase I
MSTIIVAGLFFGLLATSVLLWVVFLRLGLRWARVQGVNARRIVLATVLVVVLQIGLMILLRAVSPHHPRLALGLEVLELVAHILMPPFVIMHVFRASFLRAVQAWLPTIIGGVVMLAFALLVVRPFLMEAFVSPSNGMAPTLLGNHWIGTCLECGGPAYCSPERHASPDAPLMICRDCRHVSQPTNRDGKVFSADRFLVAKFLRPQRWDVVVFRDPEDPSVLCVMRLVGLPGEEIVIKDGRAWADGRALTSPDSISGLKYTTVIDLWPETLWGSPNRPAKLADDEYFVLGDFSPRAKDSRLWQGGARGHNPFAVPESHLYGVVTHIYWPLGRCRILR